MGSKIIIICMALLLIPYVTAFGASAPYWDTKPLNLHPGEMQEFKLLLQNMVGNKDITLKGSIEEGADIALLLDTEAEYKVPFGTKDVPVTVRVQAPIDAKPGDKYNVGISFIQVAGEEGKMIQLAGGVRTNIPIVITPLQEPSTTGAAVFGNFSSNTIIFGVVLFIIIALVIGYFIFRRD